MQKHIAEFIGTFFVYLTNGCTVDPAGHSVDDDLSERSARQQNWHLNNGPVVPTR